MATLNPKELDPVYQAVDHEEAVAIANLGAQVYVAMKDRLYETWSITQSAEEGQKAEIWRREGGQAMMESLKARLAAGDAAAARAAALQASVDSEIERRVGEVLETYRKDYELAKMEEVHALEKQIAETKGKEHYIKMVEEGHLAMKEKIAALETQVAEQIIANTKSSHAIGKVGEAEIFDMLVNDVCNEFPFAEVKDMAHISHAADFHLSVIAGDGSKVKILIDSKKYKRPIQTVEIDKLNSDVDADEEARAGLMISHESTIQTKKQFSISRTEKNKPVMYITFQNMDGETKRKTLCWAVRVLQSIALEKNIDEKLKMINEVDSLLTSLERSIKKIDGVIRFHVKTMDATKEIRNELIQKIAAFKRGGEVLEGAEEDTIEHIEDDMDSGEGNCVSILKKTGKRCNRLAVSGSDKCGLHMERTIKPKNPRNTVTLDN
jgi:hypothetical protein